MFTVLGLGAVTVGYSQACGIEIVSTVVDRARERLSPKDFGAKADGVTDDTTAIKAMFAAIPDTGMEIDWGNFTYYCGQLNIPVRGGIFQEGSAKFDIVGKTNVIFNGNPTFLINNKLPKLGSSVVNADLWRFTDCANLKLNINVIADFFSSETPQGVCAVTLVSDTVDTSGYDIIVTAKNCFAGLQTCRKNNADSKGNPHNIVGLTFYVEADNGEYGYRALNCGFNVCGRIKTKDIVRSYFPVGVQNHTIEIESDVQKKFMDVLIKAYSDPVKNIDIIFKQRNSRALEWPISIEHETDTDDTVIQGITITADIAGRMPTGRAYHPELVQIGRSMEMNGKIRLSTNCITDDINVFVSYDANESVSTAGIVFGSKNNKGGIIRTNLHVLSNNNGFTVISDALRKIFR